MGRHPPRHLYSSSVDVRIIPPTTGEYTGMCWEEYLASDDISSNGDQYVYEFLTKFVGLSHRIIMQEVIDIEGG